MCEASEVKRRSAVLELRLERGLVVHRWEKTADGHGTYEMEAKAVLTVDLNETRVTTMNNNEGASGRDERKKDERTARIKYLFLVSNIALMLKTLSVCLSYEDGL
jgi:hypothetical protein